MRTQIQARKLCVLLVIGVLMSMGWSCATLPKPGDEGQAKNIILLIGDGLPKGPDMIVNPRNSATS